MGQTEVTNMPVAALWVVAIAQILFAVAVIAIAIVMIKMVGQLSEILTEVKEMVSDDVRRQLMPNVAATLKNVKVMSDDARDTTHNVTGTVNRVSHVVGSVAGRLESPVIRTVGALAGVAAGMRALGGKKPAVVEQPAPKRRGLLGIFK